MNIRKMVDDYVECNEFEVKIIKGKVKIYYYDKINCFTQDKISVLKGDKKVSIEGQDLVIETMFEELMVISGNIKNISIGKANE